MKKCFIIFSLLFIFFSCSDDSIISEQENFNSIEHAQKWFEQNINASSSSNGRISSRPKNVSWENGISYVKDKTQTIEVPIQYETELIVYPQSINKNASYRNLTKLLMFDDGKGGYFIFIMRIMPDIASVAELDKNTYDKKTNSFTGDIIYYTWEGKPIVYTRYEKGKRIEWNYIEQSSKKGDTSGARVTNECYTIEVDWYQIVCIDGYCSGPIYLDTDYYYYCSGGWSPNSDEDVYPGDLYGGGSSGNGGTIESRQQALNEIVQSNPAALLEIPCDQLPQWQTLVQHMLSQSLINKLATYNSSPQYIVNAEGALVNLDYFSIKVSTLPIKPGGGRYTAIEFLDYVRKNLNSFLDNNVATFSPYNDLIEKPLWESSNPFGAIMRFDIPVALGGLASQDGTVICSSNSTNEWTFTTVESPVDWNHPVSGHRQFGVVTNGDGTYTFFTRGVDRVTENFDLTMADWFKTKTPFQGGDALWTSFQVKLEAFINNPTNAGVAQKQNPVTARPDWEKVKDVLLGNRPISDLGCE